MMNSPPPTAKRRRVDQAASKLTKPFRSPIRKQVPKDGSEDASGMESTAADAALGAKPETQLLSPSTQKLPTITATPTKPSSNMQTPMKTRISQNLPPTPILTPKPTSTTTSPEISSLKSQNTRLSTRLFSLRQELDTLQQALKIEQSKQDAELEGLIFKWKFVSREAAEELFVSAKAKVERMGGVRIWRERMRQGRDRSEWDVQPGEVNEFGCGFYEDEAGGEEDGEERKSDDGLGNDDNETFTMDMMLKSLNMDLELVGYDKVNQRWIE